MKVTRVYRFWAQVSGGDPEHLWAPSAEEAALRIFRERVEARGKLVTVGYPPGSPQGNEVEVYAFSGDEG